MIPSDPGTAFYNLIEPERDRSAPMQAQKYYEDDQLRAMIDFFEARWSKTKARDNALMAVMLCTAGRVSASCSLNISDYKDMLRENVVQIKIKGGKDHYFYIDPYAITQIERYLALRGPCKDGDPLFITNCGNRVTRKRAYEQFKIMQKHLAYVTGTRPYRNTVITEVAYKQGLDQAQLIAGHARQKTTRGYVKTKKSEASKAAGIMAHLYQDAGKPSKIR